MDKIRTKSVEKLLEVFANIKDKEDIYNLLLDLCTIKEIQDMSQRLETAELLQEGKSYQEIMAKTRVSTATISRINRCLHYGSDGYEKAFASLKGSKNK